MDNNKKPCGCAHQQENLTTYSHWKQRRKERRAQYNTATQENELEAEMPHVYWRQRRRERLGLPAASYELLNTIPVLQFSAATAGPVSALPVVNREFENEIFHAAETPELGKGSVRLVYVYFGPTERERLLTLWRSRRNLYPGDRRWQMRISRIMDAITNCKRPHHWRQSEEDVANQYKQQFPRNTAQQAYSNGVRTAARGSGSTVPDITLPFRAIQSGMQLKTSVQKEMVEVKRYKPENIPNLLSTLTHQIVQRAQQGRPGKHQSVILDFRGYENQCAEVQAAARSVAERLRQTAPGVQILVQVLLWHGCPNSCKPLTS